MQVDADTLRGLLGPSYKVAADPTNDNVVYVLSATGEVAAYVHGDRQKVSKAVAEQVKRNIFPEKPAASPKLPKGRSISDLPYEQQERYQAASDVLAGVKLGATAQDRKRAVRFMEVVHSWVRGDLDKENSEGG